MSPHRPFFHLFNRFLMPLFCVLLGKLDGLFCLKAIYRIVKFTIPHSFNWRLSV